MGGSCGRVPFEAAEDGRTRSDSLAARLATGRKTKRKKTERMTKPYAARNCGKKKVQVSQVAPAGPGGHSRTRGDTIQFEAGMKELSATYDNSVVPGKDGELIEASDKVPSSGCVASYEDTKRECGKGVHRIAVATSVAFRDIVWLCFGRAFLASGERRCSLSVLIPWPRDEMRFRRVRGQQIL